MIIDSSGQVGIGTTSPSSLGLLAVGDGATGTKTIAINGSGSSTSVMDIDFRGGGTGGPAGRVRFESSTKDLSFWTGNYASIAQRMTITDAGNVGIGTTSPSTYSNAPELVIDTGTSGGITVKSGTAGYGAVFFADGTTGNEQYRGSIQYNHDFSGVTDALLFGTAGAERMRIDSSGNVGINTTSPNASLHISQNPAVLALGSTGSSDPRFDFYDQGTTTIGASIFLDQSEDILCLLRTASGSATDGIRIDSSGNLRVGTPSQINSTKTGIFASSTTNCLGLQNTNNNNYLITALNSSSTEVFRVAGDGDVVNTNNSYGAISDERLKSNIVDASSQIDDIMAVQVRSYTLDSTGDTHIGVVAQELEASGMSGLVQTDKEGMKSVKYSVLYMKAIKALQEAVTRIETLEAEVAALKGA